MQANYQFSELIQALLTELEVKSDHVYFVHPSTDILVDTLPICRLRCVGQRIDRCINQDIGRVMVDISADYRQISRSI